jgi:hypothetical protein
MPSASNELRAKITSRFGSLDDGNVIKYLESKGWTLDRNWTWSKPGQNLQSMPDDEYECVLFLVREWDFGGVNDCRAIAQSPVTEESAEPPKPLGQTD